jgi:hypothetical protein
MNKSTIYVKTAKGSRELSAGSHELARDLRIILNAIDGNSSVDFLRGKFDFISATELDEVLAELVGAELIRESTGADEASLDAQAPASPDDVTDTSSPQGDESLRKANELRAKIRDRRKGGERRSDSATEPSRTERRSTPGIRSDGGEVTQDREQAQARRDQEARHDAEVQAQREAEEAAQREDAEHARREAEVLARRVAEEKALRDAEAAAQRQAEELARRKEAERVRQEAEEQARRAVEEQARKLAEEEARVQAAEEARKRTAAEDTRKRVDEESRRQAEIDARNQAEETARRAAAESARQDAEAHALWMTEQQAWRETEAKTRAAQEEAALKRAEAREEANAGNAGSEISRKWGVTIALGIVALVVAGLVVIHLISFDGQIPQFEKALAGQFQQPVKIKALRVSLVPRSQLRLEGVSIGGDGQIRVSEIRASGSPGNLFSDRKQFSSLELDSLAVTEEGLGWILFGKPQASTMEFGQVAALNAKLESKNVSLPAFDAKLQSGGEGAWKVISLESVDKNLVVELTSGDRAIQLDVKARAFTIPFGSSLTLEELVAKATADASGLVVSEFKGFVYGGILAGNARLKWGANWSLEGELNAKQIDASRLAPELLADARLAGTASYSMQAAEAAKLFATPHLEGSFNMPRGTLLGVDLGKVLQGAGMRGETKFTDLSGTVVHDRGATQLRQMRLSQTPISATGTADIGADKVVRGQVAAELKSSVEQLRARLALSGSLGKVDWTRQ